MELRIQHVSGSKAGLEQTFAPGAIRIGREQSNDVAFDPYQDILVSGRHAEIAYDGGHWVLRDLGSSNGTFIGDERITVRPLHSGEMIQLGRGGPRLQVKFQSAAPPPAAPRARGVVDNPGTRVMSIDDLVAGNSTSGGSLLPRNAPPTQDGTVMMNRSDMQPSRVAAPSRKRSGPPWRMMLLAATVALFAGIIGVLLLSKPSQKAQPAKENAAVELQRVRAELAAREAQLAELQRLQTQNTDTTGVVAQDLQRQYELARDTIDQMKLEIERKNDEVLSAENKPAKIVYVPVPQRVPVIVERAPAAAAPSPQQPAVAEAAAVAPIIPAPAASASARPAITESEPPPVRPQIEPSQPQPAQSARAVPPPAPVVAAVAASTEAIPQPETTSLKLANVKRLRKRVAVSGIASEIPFPDAPRNLPADLAKSVAASLASSSDFFVDRNSGAVVRITPMLFRSIEKKSDSGSFVNKVKGIGSIFGGPLGSVSAPVRARSVSYDAALAAQVSVESSTGRVLARTTVSSSLTDRRSSVEIVPAKTSFGDLLNQDTPQSDVTRNVVGQAVDDVMRALSAAETDVAVKSVRGQIVTLDAGRNANIAPDDVFDIVDGDQVVGRVGVESVQDGSATGRMITGSAAAGKRARYAGTDVTNGDAAPHSSLRFANVRMQTEGKDAPGSSFKTVSVLRPGVRLTYLYSVGTWSKVTNADTPMWVPTMTIDIQ